MLQSWQKLMWTAHAEAPEATWGGGSHLWRALYNSEPC